MLLGKFQKQIPSPTSPRSFVSMPGKAAAIRRNILEHKNKL